MKKYEPWRAYPYNTYGNAIVLCAHLPHAWMEENLVATQPKYQEDDATREQTFIGHIIGYQCWTIDDHLIMYSFYDPENRRRVMERRAFAVVEADPFGPDLCPKCGNHSYPEPAPAPPPPSQRNCWDPRTWFGGSRDQTA